MAVKITCVDKPSANLQDPHEAISQFGWFDINTRQTMYSTRLQMVEFLETGGSAYVEDSQGNFAYCQVRTSIRGTKFLQTVTDNRWSDNLLSLPRCTY